jgi:hypothetical protein
MSLIWRTLSQKRQRKTIAALSERDSALSDSDLNQVSGTGGPSSGGFGGSGGGSGSN